MTAGPTTLRDQSSQLKAVEVDDPIPCDHCGLPCPGRTYATDRQVFCCLGCKTVFELLRRSGLGRFYDLEHRPGIRPEPDPEYGFLDDPEVRTRLLDFTDGEQSRVTLHIPAMHCVACVWLLENLYRLHPGVGRGSVHFPRKEVTLRYEESRITLRGVVELLSSLGYAPRLQLTDLDRPAPEPGRRDWPIQIGIAGFAFGNIMILSLASYLGLDPTEGAEFRSFFGYVSLVLAVPVLLISASDYWKSAWRGLRHRMLTIEVPIALGAIALFTQSAWEILSGAGEGYLDSFAGLIFFLLCGKWFQRRTYDTLSFDHDYKSYFPLAVRRRGPDGETTVPVSNLRPGDRIVVRHQELIPADSILRAGDARIDFSFVTGESAPVAKSPGDHIFAGGRQTGGPIELEIVKPVSQSYLTSLWNSEIFHSPPTRGILTLTDRVSQVFTAVVLTLAGLVGIAWCFHDPSRAVWVVSAVLIVACPCALALSAPFTLGTAVRVLGRHRLYLRDASVVEALAGIDRVVFDKTGTLTQKTQTPVRYVGDCLAPRERSAVKAAAGHSTHPISVRIHQELADAVDIELAGFRETSGAGIEGQANGTRLVLGSDPFLASQGISVPADATDGSSGAHLGVNGQYRGRFTLDSSFRPELAETWAALAARYQVSLLSGDQPRDESALRALVGADARLWFEQSPHQKMAYIEGLQQDGHRALMVGDGLNDAGALKQSDVGIAVSEDISAFSPASDGILAADAFARLPRFLAFAGQARRIILASFGLSLMYNAVGIAFAARGLLSPVFAAVLMPLSSISVVVFAVGATEWAARRLDWGFP